MANIYDKASLVMIPSGIKEGKLFSQKPVNGDGDFTFSRSTAATRVNADGNIEKETQNLIDYSNTFNQWSVTNITFVGGQTGYDGSSDATQITSSANGGQIRNNENFSGVNTLSIYAKQGSQVGIRLRMDADTDADIYVDLRDGSLFSSSNIIDSNVESLGSGWYRCSFSANVSNGVNIRVYPVNSSGTISTGSILIQDAQLEQGLVARDYIETTTAAVEGGITDNVPRLDYTDSSCPALLLEPQRTNAITQSEYIGAWTGFGGVQTITDNYAVSPEGIQNAARVELEKSPSLSRIQLSATGTSNGVSCVFSVYLKANSGSPYVYLQAGPNVGTAIEVTNEWERYDLVGTASGGNTTCIIGISDSVSGTTETADILVYGAQLESSASYATSYIPTYGTSVTRNEETTNVLSATDLIGQSEGTMFVEVDAETIGKMGSNGTQRIIMVSDGTNTNRTIINFYENSSNITQVEANLIKGTSQASFANTISENKKYKLAFAYKENDFTFYANGVQIGTDTSGSTYSSGTLTRLDLGQDITSTLQQANPIKQALLFKTRLSNEELAALTTI